MKKISLDLDALAVETFATTAADGAEGGTVAAFVRTNAPAHTCGDAPSCPTCDYLQSCYCAITAFGVTCVEPTCYAETCVPA